MTETLSLHEKWALVCDTLDAIANTFDSKRVRRIPPKGDINQGWARSYLSFTMERGWCVYLSHGLITVYEYGPHVKVSMDQELLPVGHATPITQTSAYYISSEICRAILGVPYIPIASRAQLKATVRMARQDACQEFQSGLTHILETGQYGKWAGLDDAERWERVMDAASASGHVFKMRKIDIPFRIRDVYDDAYYEKAGELMGTIGKAGT